MTLENPSFLNDLDQSAPTFQDFQNEGDDHLRNIKKALKQTFPGMTGRIWRRRNVAASAALDINDNSSLVRVSTTATLTPASASTLGNCMAVIRAEGGNVTIDPSGVEKVNGVTSMVIPSGYTGFLFCDGTEFFMMLTYQDVPAQAKAFPTGTRMVFQQTSAPTGWTKITNTQYDNAALRFTTGTVGTGGADAFTTHFGSGKSTAGFGLTDTYNGVHNHGGGRDGSAAGVGPGWGVDGTSVLCNRVGTEYAGGGAAHAHTLNNFNIKYADCIIASIN